MIRQKLIEYRGKHSQKEMAKKYKVSQQTWSNWELGKRTPNLNIIKKIEDDSGIPMEEIFYDIFNNYELSNN